ncbi:MAG: helix-turn-helix domain-containing protein [Myxococcaceae bacterium]|nr:helix-turn-helix domain-containing protein [Myxococcaceae bacterium]
MSRWALLVVTPQRVAPVDLPVGRPLFVGRGRGASLELKDPQLEERHLSFRIVDDRPVVDPLGPSSGVRVNDVPCSAPMPLVAGDEVAVGENRLVVLALSSPRAGAPRLASEDELVVRLDEEARRASRTRPLGLVFVSTSGLNVAARQALTRRVVDAVAQTGAVACWGELAADLLTGLIPELPAADLERVVSLIGPVAGPRAQTASAVAPRDGVLADQLFEAAWCRLLAVPPAVDEPTLAEASTVRLFAMADELASRPGPVVVTGPSGSGRTTFARALFRSRGLEPVVLEGGALHEGLASAARAPGVLVRDVDQSSQEQLLQLLDPSWAKRRLVVLTAASRLEAAPVVVEVPGLSQRPADVVALAEAFLREARAAVGRPRLSLSDDARRVLSGWAWPGEVRELRWVMLRAARAAVRDEVGPDALPARLSAAGSSATLRSALKDAERELLLEALARTRWNVTAAATRLGLPRRTVVYRMARLGLRRPSR